METKKFRESTKMQHGFGSDVYEVSLLVSDSEDEVLLKGKNGELFSCENVKDFPHYKVVKANGKYYAYAEGKDEYKGKVLAEDINTYHELSDGSIIVELVWFQSRFGRDDACTVRYFHIHPDGSEKQLNEGQVNEILYEDRMKSKKAGEDNQPGGPQ